MRRMDTGPWRVWVSLVGAGVAMAAAAVECWRQPSFMGWLTAAVVVVILLVVVVGYDQPGRYLVSFPWRWLTPVVGFAGLTSVARMPRLRWPHVSSLAMGGVVVTLVVLAFVLWGLREPTKAEMSSPLSFPLRSGRWVVAAGGVAAMNHHLQNGPQSGAVDLVALRDDGARARGIAPRELTAYEAYGRPVTSPCDGVVVAALDGQSERLGVREYGDDPCGNHVRIDTGRDVVHLAHLRPGSVRVATGDSVRAGQLLGEVGCSGRTREPNLHMHAERSGEGLRLRFVDVGTGCLTPGRPVRVTEGGLSGADRR